jgi:DNA repair protein RadC
MRVPFNSCVIAEAMTSASNRVDELRPFQPRLHAHPLRDTDLPCRGVLPSQRESGSNRGPKLKELTYVYRTKLGADGRPVHLGSPIARPGDISALLRSLLEHEPVEVLGVLCLTTRRRIICWHEVSRGSVNATSVDPREVFRAAISVNAAAIIAAHNHPSGDAAPSPDDLRATRKLVDAGSILGVAVLDHVIVGHDTCVSLRAAGVVDFRDHSTS